jgi:hypothetical protein
MTLRTFMSDDSEILGRKATGLCAKCQRKVSQTIKRARNFGLVSHLGNFDIRPVHPLKPEGIVLHKHINSDKEKVVNAKTVI